MFVCVCVFECTFLFLTFHRKLFEQAMKNKLLFVTFMCPCLVGSILWEFLRSSP